jgi:hypothetical protein
MHSQLYSSPFPRILRGDTVHEECARLPLLVPAWQHILSSVPFLHSAPIQNLKITPKTQLDQVLRRPTASLAIGTVSPWLPCMTRILSRLTAMRLLELHQYRLFKTSFVFQDTSLADFMSSPSKQRPDIRHCCTCGNLPDLPSNKVATSLSLIRCTLMAIIRASQEPRTSCSISLFELSRSSECSDVRNYVYGLLGLLNPQELRDSTTSVDYSKSATTLFL